LHGSRCFSDGDLNLQGTTGSSAPMLVLVERRVLVQYVGPVSRKFFFYPHLRANFGAAVGISA
jgi:hypothetical protein